MVKTMKRSLSLMFALVMLFCAVPISTVFAEDTKQVAVVVNKAPIRKSPKQEGKVLERCKEGQHLDYVGFRINSKLNLWYQVKCSNGSIGYIYSGNVAAPSKLETCEPEKYLGQVEMSRDYLNQDKCLKKAEEITNATDFTKEQIARELYAHAYCYYKYGNKFKDAVKMFVTDALICTLMGPNSTQCLSRVAATTAVLSFAKWCSGHAGCINLGEGNDIEGVTRTVIYEIIWRMND